MKRMIVTTFAALSMLVVSCGNNKNDAPSDTAIEIDTDSSSVNTGGSGDSLSVPDKGSADLNRGGDTTRMSY